MKPDHKTLFPHIKKTQHTHISDQHGLWNLHPNQSTNGSHDYRKTTKTLVQTTTTSVETTTTLAEMNTTLGKLHQLRQKQQQL